MHSAHTVTDATYFFITDSRSRDEVKAPSTGNASQATWVCGYAYVATSTAAAAKAR